MPNLTIIFTLVLSVTVASISCMPSTETEWIQWKLKFGKSYMSEVDEYEHWKVWMKNYKYVQEFNSTDAGFSVELNAMADQFVSRTPLQYNTDESETWVSNTYQDSPDSWDWREKGAIGPVRSQGQMGDVLTFVVTECVESYGAVTTGKLTDVSFYEVHDCCTQSRLAVDDAFNCIHDIGGVCSVANYPRSTGKCMNSSCQAVVQVNGGKMVASGDENALKDAVYKMPVMVLIDASRASFQLYRSGVYSDPSCSSKQLDHSLQVVGYGSDNGVDYWICRNSWGVNWGMEGYINIARNKGNMCGIATHATYPV